ncbi:TPA: hypothetical protein ACXM9H_002957 [Burkholderia multivorans]
MKGVDVGVRDSDMAGSSSYQGAALPQTTMSTETVSPEEIESTRMLGARNESEILRAVARVTQARVADCMSVSPSTISRTLEDLNRWSVLLAAAGRAGRFHGRRRARAHRAGKHGAQISRNASPAAHSGGSAVIDFFINMWVRTLIAFAFGVYGGGV